MPAKWITIGRLRIRTDLIIGYRLEGDAVKLFLPNDSLIFKTDSEEAAEALVKRLDQLINPSPLQNFNLN